MRPRERANVADEAAITAGGQLRLTGEEAEKWSLLCSLADYR